MTTLVNRIVKQALDLDESNRLLIAKDNSGEEKAG